MDGVAIRSGGIAGVLVVVNGSTMTVFRCWFTSLVERITHGRVLEISAPLIGSSSTQYTLPRKYEVAGIKRVKLRLMIAEYVALHALFLALRA